MRQRRHILGATFYLAAVLAFAIGDATTKLLTQGLPAAPILSVRCLFALFYLYVACRFLNIRLPIELLTNRLLLAKAAIFTLTIWFFALSFKYGQFVTVYSVFFVVLPISSTALSYYFHGRVPSKKFAFIVSFMCICALLAVGDFRSFEFGSGIWFPAATAFFFSAYLATSELVNEAVEIDSLSQEIPSFFYGFIGLLIVSGLGKEIGSFSEIVSVKTIPVVALASLFSALGLVAINRATSFENSERLAPYEYSVMIYALFIDRLMFDEALQRSHFLGAIGIVIGAILLSKINESSDADDPEK